MSDADLTSFRLGVNYWPVEAAMAWLAHYDPAGTRRDFERAARAGFDSIRVFVRWEDVQPTETRIDRAVLQRLVDAADAAVEAGVSLVVTLFVGHMSGANWIPAWATAGAGGDRRFRVISAGEAGTAGLRNWYADAGIVAAQERLAGAAAAALAGHPGLWAWDLGNENSNCTIPPDRGAGEAWLERISAAIRTGDPGRPLTIGIHMEDIEEDRLIGPVEAARYCDFVSMHGYPIYADWSDGATDDRLLPFLAAITRWLAGGAPILFQEFGLPTAARPAPGDRLLVGEDASAAYTGRALDGLRAEGCLGAMLWCFGDYAASLHGTPPFDRAVHERSFGLWRADGSPKPALAEVSARVGAPRLAPAEPDRWLDVDQETFCADRRLQLARLYRRYRNCQDADREPPGGGSKLPPDGAPPTF